MDKNQLLVLGILAAPVVVLMVLRINATLVFLSLCLGYVLMQFLGPDAKSFAETFMSHTTLSTNVMKLVLLLFPVVFTSLFMIFTVRGVKLALNVLPALAVGCLGVLLVVPLLPPGTSHAITDMSLWHQAVRLQALIVGAGALISLLFLWLQRPRRGGDEKGKKH